MRPKVPLHKIREETEELAAMSDEDREDRLRKQRQASLEKNIAELRLPVRTINVLEEYGIFTVGELLQHKPEDLKKNVKNFGDKAMNDVFKALEEIGFKRKGSENDDS